MTVQKPCTDEGMCAASGVPYGSAETGRRESGDPRRRRESRPSRGMGRISRGRRVAPAAAAIPAASAGAPGVLTGAAAGSSGRPHMFSDDVRFEADQCERRGPRGRKGPRRGGESMAETTRRAAVRTRRGSSAGRAARSWALLAMRSGRDAARHLRCVQMETEKRPDLEDGDQNDLNSAPIYESCFDKTPFKKSIPGRSGRHWLHHRASPGGTVDTLAAAWGASRWPRYERLGQSPARRLASVRSLSTVAPPPPWSTRPAGGAPAGVRQS